MKRVVCFFLVCVIFFCFYGCKHSDKNNYILNDLSGMVINGEKYVSIDIRGFGIDIVSLKEPILDEEFRMQHWTLFDSNGRPYWVDSEIMLAYASPFMPSEYYCPENRYDEYIEYLKNLSWAEKIASQSNPQTPLSEELAYYILHEASQDPTSVEYKIESNCLAFFGIVQIDTTGSFYRKLGAIVVRAKGDAYYLPVGYDYISAVDYNPIGAEYDQIAERLSSQRIPNVYIEELLKAQN